jgi:ergothioneine biosynthesis protein EgtB
MIPNRTHADRRQIFAARLATARQSTDHLFKLLRPAALVERPIPERHRLIFYLGHLEAFDRNLMADAELGMPAIHEELDRLFAFGIDPVDGALPSEPASAWPSEPDVRVYNSQVREAVDRCLQKADLEDESLDAAGALHVMIEHRLMHAETLAYAMHRLPLELKLAPPDSFPPAGELRSASAGIGRDAAMIQVPAGRATLGLGRDGRFGWDNEFEAHAVEVPAFKVGAFKVTNGEFLEFVRRGGYEERSLWNKSGWEWIRKSGLRHPSFWGSDRAGWVFHGMFQDRPLPMDEPVWISHAEAEAYACWKGLRLPTEAEWHRLACGAPEDVEREYPWGSAAPTDRHGNFDSHRWDPTPVGAFPEGRSAFGAYDTLGNGWEWTSTIFAPFPGFEAYQPYKGYSADFFDRRHFVLKGASPRTDACLLRRSFRNWFQPHYQYLYAGFRLVQP